MESVVGIPGTPEFDAPKTIPVSVVESDVKTVLGDSNGSISYYVKIMKENPKSVNKDNLFKDFNKSDAKEIKDTVSEAPVSVPVNISEDTILSREAITSLLRDRILQNESVRLLTLFTTWTYSSNKTLLHNLTVRNWISLRPFIMPVVFTNDSAIAEECLEQGWDVLPVRVEAAGGVPVLKYMYKDVMSTYITTFYAYSNSDILYTGTLIETLASLINSSLDLEKPTLIIGKRTNVEFLTETGTT